MKEEIIIEKIHSKMQSSFWYQGDGDIILIKKDDREIIISTCGRIRVNLPNENFYRKNGQAVDRALALGLSDNNLHDLEFGESNWFDFVYKKGNDNYVEIVGDECFFYSEALKSARETINDDEFWSQF